MAISLVHAKENKLFYVVATVMVYESQRDKVLLLHRSEREKVLPGKWCPPGGKLEWADLANSAPTDSVSGHGILEALAVRETMEECGLIIDPACVYIRSSSFVRPDGIPVMLVVMASKYMSGEVVLEEGAFDDYAWVDEETVGEYDVIEGVEDEVRVALARMRRKGN